MSFIDLHTHSTASDGTCLPVEIVALARELGLSAVALTDHDTMAGVPEFLEAGNREPSLEALPGVEVSVDFAGKEVHIVGLFVDHEHSGLNELLREVRMNRDARNNILISKLNEIGYEITLDEVLAIAGGESVGRPLVAKILVEKGYFDEPQAVFDSCLKRGAPAYTKRVLPSPKEVLELIKAAGGVSVWAHPLYRAANDRTYMRKVIRTLEPLGLDALEAYYTTFTPPQTQAVKEVAAEFGLLISGGSDFHGGNQPGVSLKTGKGGLAVPEELLAALKERSGLCLKYSAAR
ncbi:MAG: PHP domain-containing protein [Victivallales bacterium]|nr:PHP domain-containing protein [Victivallales bacterium]